jgi:hypothetical protein
LIGTIRRECLDRLLFWTGTDLELKLLSLKDYYNRCRAHSALEGQTPIKNPESKGAELKLYRWRNIAAVYTKRRLPHEHEFARHRVWKEQRRR